MNLKYEDVDIIIGAEHFEDCMLEEKFKEGKTTFRKSVFGWVVSGSEESNVNTASKVCHFNSFVIEEQLCKFWELEEIEPQENNQSEFERCNSHFENTYTRAENGQFIIRLTFKLDPSSLGDNYCSVSHMLKKNDNRLSLEEKIEYDKFMDEYIQLKHNMESVKKEDVNQCRYFIPHKMVIKPTSSTTKYRVVFNASFRGPNGRSLNDILMNGEWTFYTVRVI